MWNDIEAKTIIIYKWISYLIHNRIDDTEMTIYLSDPRPLKSAIFFGSPIQRQAKNSMFITQICVCKICGAEAYAGQIDRHLPMHPLLQAFLKLSWIYRQKSGAIILGNTS